MALPRSASRRPSMQSTMSEATASGSSVAECGTTRSGKFFLRSGVSTAPGFTQKERMPWRAPSTCMLRVKLSTAHALREGGQIEAAIPWYQIVVQDHPDRPEALEAATWWMVGWVIGGIGWG